MIAERTVRRLIERRAKTAGLSDIKGLDVPLGRRPAVSPSATMRLRTDFPLLFHLDKAPTFGALLLGDALGQKLISGSIVKVHSDTVPDESGCAINVACRAGVPAGLRLAVQIIVE